MQWRDKGLYLLHMLQFKKVMGVPGLGNLMFLSCERDFKVDFKETIMKLGRSLFYFL
jgi:hypothetical protein